MTSSQIRRVTWLESGRGDRRHTFASFVAVGERSVPARIHALASVLYGCLQFKSRPRRNWFEDVDHKAVEFVRPLRFSSPICWVDCRFVIRPWIAPLIRPLTTANLVPARCVGVVDIDLYDVALMNRLMESCVAEGQLNVEAIMEQHGRAQDDEDWFEVVPKDVELPAEVGVDHIRCDFRNAELEKEGGNSGLFLSTLSSHPFTSALLDKHGILATPVHVMRAEVADIFVDHLPAPFWAASYWKPQARLSG